MLILGSLVYCSFHGAWTTIAVPLVDNTTHSPTAPGDIIEGMLFQKNYRSIWDIAWGCLLTIFACTWISVHPNVRGYHSTRKARALQRVELMFWALMAPELMVAWAVRQWLGARSIQALMAEKKKTIEGNGSSAVVSSEWTITHSHFLQMGGYIFKKDGVIQYIDINTSKRNLETVLEALLQQSDTEEEIADRSKGDPLAKGFIVIQTLWFITQCIARRVQRLAITELEVTTLAYTVMSVSMYFFWWYKPLDVQCPIIVSLPPEANVRETAHSRESIVGNFARRCKLNPSVRWFHPIDALKATVMFLFDIFVNGFLQRVSHICGGPPPLPFYINSSELTQNHKFKTFSGYCVIDEAARFGRFAGIIGSILASAFGALHCSAWSFPFPSPTHQTLWRTSALYICLSPLAWVASISTGMLAYGDPDSPSTKFESRWMRLLRRVADAAFMVFGAMAAFSLLLYAPARAILVVLSVIELSHLPTMAHRSVEWADFLPHI